MSAAPSATGTQSPGPERRTGLVQEQDGRHAERHRRPEVTRGHLAGGDRGRDRPDRQAAASAHLADRHEVLEVGERLLADELPGPEVLDRGERLFRPGRDDLGGRRGPDPRQRLEFFRGRVIEVDRSRRAAAIGAPPRARGCRAGRRRVVTRRDTDLVAVAKRRGEVELATRPLGVDARTVSSAAATRSPIRAPAGNSKTPGRSTAPTISTTRTPPATACLSHRAAMADWIRGPAAPMRRRRRPVRRTSSRPRARRPRPRAPPRRSRRRAWTAGWSISRPVRRRPPRRQTAPPGPDPRGRAKASRSDPRIDLPGGMVGRRRRE